LRRTISPSINAVATLIFASSVIVLGGALMAQAIGSRSTVNSDGD
jgi:ABC-type spermidine/putrescine transport system permease subunit II